MKYTSRHLDVYFPDSALDFGNIPIATGVLTTAFVTWTIVLSVVRTQYLREYSSQGLDPDLVVCPLVQLVPDKVLSHPFSLVFSNLVDVEAWKFICNLINLLVGGAFIERFWQSPKELVIFVLGIGTLTNLLVTLITIALSMIWPSIRLDLPLDGNYTIIVGFPIIYKQLFPETTIFETKNLPFLSKNFRFKLLPIFTLAFLSVLQLIWFHHFSQLLSIWITFFTCWIYLRFFQVLPAAIAQDTEFKVVGDASETFQLIYFFPDLVKPLLAPVFDYTYKKFMVDWHIREPFRTNDIEQANSLAEKRGAKTADNSNAEERRKQLALQVLEERLLNENNNEPLPSNSIV